jgi:hypothetical protein
MPNGDTLFIDAVSFKECDVNPEPLNVDVGNIILNDEQICGVKVWERSDLNSQGRFWYDEDNDLVEMCSVSNPGSYYSHVELGLNRLCVTVDNRSYVACDNLDLRYGVFGVAGMSTHHIIVRNCDISFIGGEDQYGGSKTLRYGNGVQFWNAAHDNIVEGCAFNQIYDAAVTAQGSDVAGFEVYNINFRNNVIRNSEYSLEFWEGGSLSRAHDIFFENNTCLSAGRGWGHAQRPDPNGTHLMFFPFFAQTTNVYIRNNIFFDATEQSVRWWRKEDITATVLDNNCWYQSNGLLARIDLAAGVGQVNITYDYATQWDAYRAATKQDFNSIHADPLINADLTLQASSPCVDAGKTTTTVQTDFHGTVRPQGAGYDIGAFEASAWLIAPPTLLAPADNMKKVPIDPTLSWKKLPRAQKYSLAVSLTPTFSSLVVADTSAVDTVKAIGPLQYGTTYYWRVCAKNTGGTSDWSQVRSFTTIAATPLGPAYYVSPTGNDSNPGTESLPWKTLAKAASMATANVTVFIKQGTYNERLVPVNSGTADGPITFASYPGDSVTIDGSGMIFPGPRDGVRAFTGLVHVQGLKHIKISGLRVLNSDATGILVAQSSDVTVERNYTDNTYSPGIQVDYSDNVVVEANEVVHGSTGEDQECISFSGTTLFEIKNNRIHDGFTEGIDVKVGSSNGIVRNNEVYKQRGRNRVPPGIYIDAWDSHEFNIDVFDNVSHDNGMGFSVGCEDGGLIDAIRIHHNKAYNNGRGLWVAGWGVATQKHLFNNIAIYGNEFYGNEFGIEIGGYTGTTMDSIKVFNNLIYHNVQAGVRITRYDGPSGEYSMRNVSIVNNTIYRNGTVGNGWDADNGGVNVFNVSPVNMLMRNNILSDNAVCTIYVSPEVLAGSLTIDYNLFDGFRNYVNETAGTNPVYGIPSFVDSLRNDFHLRAASPCIDKGNPNQEYNDPADPNKPGYALYPAKGTLRNDMGAYGGPYATSWDLANSVAKPQTPVLNSPADSARGVSTTPMLSWNSVLGTDRYRVQLSTSASFSSKLVDDSMVTDSYRQVGPLLNSTTYYWRVNATNVAGTCIWSQVRSFTALVAAPLVPTLAGPVDSAKNVQLSTTLSWNAVQGATFYHLQVSTASNFGSTVVNDSTVSTVSRSVGPLTLATTYYWQVRAKNEGGWSAYSSVRQFSTIRTTSVEQLNSEMPTVYSLSQNYPNPFNPSTRIRFGIPKSGKVSLKVFDLLGRELETLVAEELAPAYYEAVWKANVASGIYFYRIESGDFVQTRKMILLH